MSTSLSENNEVQPTNAPKVEGPQPSSSVVGVEQEHRESPATTREGAATTPSNGDGSKSKKVITAADVEASREKMRAEQREKAEEQKKFNKAVKDKVRFMSRTQKDAVEAQGYCDQLVAYFNIKNGVYLRDEKGEYSVLLNGKRVPFNREEHNREFNRVLRNVCNLTLSTPIVKQTIERLADEVHDRVGKFKLRKFSAMSHDGRRLYIPINIESKLLCITTENIAPVSNGDNDDKLWLEHPKLDPDSHLFDYVPDNLNAGLAEFERLIVEPQACRVPEMRWFIAMQEVLFPFVRELFQDRLITMHEGPPGSGKTSGLDLICVLHGLVVTGDTTAPVLNRIGDCGLLAMDNKEQINMNTAFTDYLLYLATAAERFRCAAEGYRTTNRHRPIGVITSIEGAAKAELIDRMVEISYNAHERDRANFDKRTLRQAIIDRRSAILSALVLVLQRFLQIDREKRSISVPDALARFGENFKADVMLLHAYADVAEKPAGWADKIIKVWGDTLQAREKDTDELVFMVEQFLHALGNEQSPNSQGTVHDPNTYIHSCKAATYKDQKGTLTITTATQLLAYLRRQEPFNKQVLKTPQALSRRLRTVKSPFCMLTADDAPELVPRKNSQKYIGLFEPNNNTTPAPPMIMFTAADIEASRKARGLKPTATPPTDARLPVEPAREVYGEPLPETDPTKMS